MGAHFVPIVVFTALWGIVGIVLPFVVPKGPNRGILQVVLMLTAATCWLFWLCCYMAQMNPLIGPKLAQKTILIMAREWAIDHVDCATTFKNMAYRAPTNQGGDVAITGANFNFFFSVHVNSRLYDHTFTSYVD